MKKISKIWLGLLLLGIATSNVCAMKRRKDGSVPEQSGESSNEQARKLALKKQKNESRENCTVIDQAPVSQVATEQAAVEAAVADPGRTVQIAAGETVMPEAVNAFNPEEAANVVVDKPSHVDAGVIIPKGADTIAYLPEHIFEQVVQEVLIKIAADQNPEDLEALFKIIKQIWKLRRVNKKLLAFMTAENIARIMKSSVLKCFDVNKTGEQDSTLLHFVCKIGRVEVVEVLCRLGADVKKADKLGWIPLHDACASGFSEITRVLCKFKSDVNKADECGWTPLHKACDGRHVEVVAVLHEAKANLNDTDYLGWTALHRACWNGYAEVVSALCKAGAETDKVDKLGRTALHCACYFSYPMVIEMLCIAKVDLNKTDNSGGTPLHKACLRGDSQVARILIEHGAIVPEDLKSKLRKMGIEIDK